MTRPHSTVEKCTTGMACQTRHLQAFEKLKTGVLQQSAVKAFNSRIRRNVLMPVV